MTTRTTPISNSAEVPWRAWQAESAEIDRRTATRARQVMTLLATVLAMWVFAQLT